MFWVVLTFLVLISISVVIIAAVAAPHWREGSDLLTERGEELVRQAKARLTNSPSES